MDREGDEILCEMHLSNAFRQNDDQIGLDPCIASLSLNVIKHVFLQHLRKRVRRSHLSLAAMHSASGSWGFEPYPEIC